MTPKRQRRIIEGHRITWWVYARDHDGRVEKLRKTSKMTSGWNAFDAACECGWESRTGGALRGSVERDVRSHKFDVTGDWRNL